MGFSFDGIKIEGTEFINNYPIFTMVIIGLLILFWIVRWGRNKLENDKISKINKSTERIEKHTTEILDYVKTQNVR